MFAVSYGLVTLRLCEEQADGRYALTAAGRSLAHGSASSLREKVMVIAGQYWQPWLSLEHCLETGEPSFPFVFGMPVAAWRRAHPEESAPLYRYLAKEEMAHADDILPASSVFETGSVVASIGGGYGGLLVPLLTGRPDLEGIVFDESHVAEAAKALFGAFGLADRVACVSGDILKAIPVQADVYLLKGVLQQHSDAHARIILENCRKAMSPKAKLVVVERLLPERAADDPAAIMLDLHLMAIYGGRARTKAEMEALLAETGLSVSVLRTAPPGLTTIEATLT